MSSEAQKAKAPTKARIWILAGLCIIAGLLWSANWYFVSKFVSDEKQGQFGDMFGAVNALFTALAFAGLIYTVLLQRDQLALQQQEIVESGKTQEQLVQRQIDAQDKLFERQKAFQEEQRQKQIAHELKLEELRQNFEDLVERRRKDRETESQELFAKNVLRAIRCELEALDELYYAGIGKDLANTADGNPLKVRFALTQDFYTVFNANAVNLGKVDPKIAKQAIKVYALVKGQVDNLRINNILLDEFDRLEEARTELLSDAFASDFVAKVAAHSKGAGARKEQIQTLLILHARLLKKHQSVLKEEYLRRCSLLDNAGIN